MKLVFTKSSLPLSKLIRWGLNEPVSHVGIVFDNGIIFHSNLLGTHIQWYKSFLKGCEIVYSIEYTMHLEKEESIYLNILNTYDGLPYDYKAFFYFIYRGLLNKLLGIPFPKNSPFQDSGKFLCTELAGVLPSDILQSEQLGRDISIISPYKLYLKLRK